MYLAVVHYCESVITVVWPHLALFHNKCCYLLFSGVEVRLAGSRQCRTKWDRSSAGTWDGLYRI